MSASPINSHPPRLVDAASLHRGVRPTSAPAKSQSPADAISLSTSRRAALVTALLVHIPRIDRTAAAVAIPAILDAVRATKSNDPNRIGYLLATAQTESDFGSQMTETGHSKLWYDRTYGGDDGNRPGTHDGYTFRGRGYVQTTHAGRYAELSHRLRLPDEPAIQNGKSQLDERGRPKLEPALIVHPERLVDPKLAAKALVIGVEENLFTHNRTTALEKTIPLGMKPGAVDFYHARGIVNGIVKSQAQTIASHATAYAQIIAGYQHSALDLPAGK